jgi:hypothetical protein
MNRSPASTDKHLHAECDQVDDPLPFGAVDHSSKFSIRLSLRFPLRSVAFRETLWIPRPEKA